MLDILVPWHKPAVNKKRLVVCRVGEGKPFWNRKLRRRWSTLASDINNLVRSPGGPQTDRSTASSKDLPIFFLLCRSLYDSQIVLLFFYFLSTHAGDSDPTPVNPCYDGSHTCATTAQCHPATGVDYTCECASGYQGDGRSCVGKSRMLCVPSRSPSTLCP